MDYRFKALGEFPSGGSLFRLDEDCLVEMEQGITCSNGLAFSPDGKRLYHSDGPTGVVHVWDLDPATGAISDKRTFVTLTPGEGFCDGVTVDQEGGYWMTLVFGGKLRRYLPDGQLDIEVELPFEAPTKLAFGGTELDTLYITTTKISVGLPPNPMHGGVYAFKPGMRGVAEAMLVDRADVGG
jgi:sugar lactone lactonase YvrE